LKTDPAHCGACGRVCRKGCVHGACRCETDGDCGGDGCLCAAVASHDNEKICLVFFDLNRPCHSDAECPLGSVCELGLGVGFMLCTVPCPL
jgi:hypothetical protein